jgi:hypothetical protein
MANAAARFKEPFTYPNYPGSSSDHIGEVALPPAPRAVSMGAILERRQFSFGLPARMTGWV